MLNKIIIRSRITVCLREAIRCRSTASILDTDVRKPTINEVEVEKLSKLSSRWWDETGDLKGLHAMNKLRVQLIRDSLLSTKKCAAGSTEVALPLKGFKIMDVGCGGGILAEPLARIGAAVTGLDASVDLIEVAKRHACEQEEITQNLQYLCGSVEDLAKEKPEYYDAVVASEVLEHVNEKEFFLESCAHLLKPGGSIFITTLNKTMVAWVAGVMAAEHVLHLVPRDTHDWDKFIAPHHVQYMLEKHGCYTTLIHGMFYNFLCNEWFWTNSTDINYALHAVKKKL